MVWCERKRLLNGREKEAAKWERDRGKLGIESRGRRRGKQQAGTREEKGSRR